MDDKTPFEILLNQLNSNQHTYRITGMGRKMTDSEINHLMDRMDLPSGEYIIEDWDETTDITTITFTD